MTLSLRTIKIVLATTIAIFFAEMLHLDYTVAAGIIAILSISDTKLSSLKTAAQRIVSTVVALAIAAVLFQLFGFTDFTSEKAHSFRGGMIVSSDWGDPCGSYMSDNTTILVLFFCDS